MKRVIFLCLSLCAIGTLYGQEGVFIGFGAEANGNTFGKTAVGGGWSLGVDFNRYAALGIKTTFSYDLDSLAIMEQAVFFRFYLPLKIRGPFIHLEAGGSIFLEDRESYLMPLGGITAGWRIGIGKTWYIEPVAGAGYPFVWRGGINVGIRTASPLGTERLSQ